MERRSETLLIFCRAKRKRAFQLTVWPDRKNEFTGRNRITTLPAAHILAEQMAQGDDVIVNENHGQNVGCVPQVTWWGLANDGKGINLADTAQLSGNEIVAVAADTVNPLGEAASAAILTTMCDQPEAAIGIGERVQTCLEISDLVRE